MEFPQVSLVRRIDCGVIGGSGINSRWSGYTNCCNRPELETGRGVEAVAVAGKH